MGEIRLSVVIPVYNSHRAFYRQLRWWKRLALPNSVEIMILDDESDPPLSNQSRVPNVVFHRSGLKHRWEEGYACNLGVMLARGSYIYKTDIDHIISRESVDAALEFTGDKMIFPRFFAVLDNAGRLVQDHSVMRQWKLHEKYIERDLNGGTHGNTWVMKKQIFLELGGFRHRTRVRGQYSGYLDSDFNNRYTQGVKDGRYQPQVGGPKIFCFPMGRFTTDNNNNPHGFFHDLSRAK